MNINHRRKRQMRMVKKKDADAIRKYVKTFRRINELAKKINRISKEINRLKDRLDQLAHISLSNYVDADRDVAIIRTDIGAHVVVKRVDYGTVHVDVIDHVFDAKHTE